MGDTTHVIKVLYGKLFEQKNYNKINSCFFRGGCVLVFSLSRSRSRVRQQGMQDNTINDTDEVEMRSDSL